MGELKDITNCVFGELTALAPSYKRHGVWYWQCSCSCGRMIHVNGSSLRRGRATHCGCSRKYNGMLSPRSQTRLYRIWSGMKSRCYTPTDGSYSKYGALGVLVCDEWLSSFESFETWAYQNGYSPELTLDRLDPFGDYTPDNCRWCTLQEQNRNKRNTVMGTFNGETRPVAEWADIYNVPYHTMYQRFKFGRQIDK